MNNLSRSLLSVALTAGAVYLLDPVSGRRRRLLLVDQCERTARNLELRTRDARHELSNQFHSFTARTPANRERAQTSDKALCKQARAAIERSTTHPTAVECTAHDGNVYVRGDILTFEHQHLLDELRSIDGIRVITDHLTPREPHEGVREHPHGNGNDGWSIAGRVFAGATGCALVLWGIKERKALGELGTSAGHALRDFSQKHLHEGAEALEKGLESTRDASGQTAEVLESVHIQTHDQPASATAARAGIGI